jgi:hypothetical protein
MRITWNSDEWFSLFAEVRRRRIELNQTVSMDKVSYKEMNEAMSVLPENRRRILAQQETLNTTKFYTMRAAWLDTIDDPIIDEDDEEEN